MAEIPILSATDPTEKMAELLDEAGCLVVTDAFDAERRRNYKPLSAATAMG